MAMPFPMAHSRIQSLRSNSTSYGRKQDIPCAQPSASKQKTFKHLYKLVQACTSCKSSEFDNSTSYVRKSARPFLILPHKSSKLTTLERLQDLQDNKPHKLTRYQKDHKMTIMILQYI